MKDNFSSASDMYAKYRPAYPPDFFDYLNSLIPDKHKAWDCGTGNGQIAYELAKTFDKVVATDISRSQLDNALRAGNISYSVQPAEKTNFRNKQFDLITVAQAVHWFDFNAFYSEVRRTAREKAILCITGYGLPVISERTDKVISGFYKNIIGSYWDKERTYIDEGYKTIPFPFNEIPAPRFANIQHWTLGHLTGYLNTWSAVKHFIRQNEYNPVDALQTELEESWGNAWAKEVRFPMLLRIGQVSS